MLITTAGLLKSSVYPSGADLATYSFAMLVPAPGRFSTITCWGKNSESFDASTRALMATPPPGENPTMGRGGLDGEAGAGIARPRPPRAGAHTNATPRFPLLSRPPEAR